MRKQRHAANYNELSEALGYSRRQLQTIRKDPQWAGLCPRPRPNGRHDIEAWRTFLTEHGVKAEDTPETLTTKQELLQVKLEREKWRLAKEQSEYIAKHLVLATAKRCVAQWFHLIERMFVNELPLRLRGLDERQISAIMHETYEKLTEEARRGIVEPMEKL